MNLPQVVTQEEWVAARKRLLAKEKELTRQRDALNTARRNLPMVRIEKDYRFTGPEGEVGLLDLFAGRQLQLVLRRVLVWRPMHLGQHGPRLLKGDMRPLDLVFVTSESVTTAHVRQ